MTAFEMADAETQRRVCTAMAQHTHKFMAAISRVLSEDLGEHCGTGTYMELRNTPYILTNEHVASERRMCSLAHQPRQGEPAHRIVHPFLCMEEPIDAGLSRIDHESWGQEGKAAIPPSRIARRHRTVPHELLFLHGYSGERSRFSGLAGGLVSRSTPYLTQERDLPPGLDRRVYLSLHYNPEHARSVDGKPAHLPLPPGFSGSLVWNTRYHEVGGRNWTPDAATVIGLIRGWPAGQYADSLIGVRIEVVRDFMVIALRQEAAYFRWVSRGRPHGDDLADWLWAEEAIKDI